MYGVVYFGLVAILLSFGLWKLRKDASGYDKFQVWIFSLAAPWLLIHVFWFILSEIARFRSK
jgi:hypothetical protein